MRTTTGTYFTLKYPDALCFAFNPVTFKATDAGNAGVKELEVVASTGGKSVTAKYYGYAGQGVFCDVEGIVQSLFNIDTAIDYASNDPTSCGKTITFDVTAIDAADNSEQFHVSSFVVWGGLNSDGQDVFNGYRRVKWFADYPFTMGFYSGGAGSILLSKDAALTHYASISGQGMYAISQDEIPSGANYSLIYDYSGTLIQATFDNTFDLTFYLDQNVPQTLVMRVDVDRCHYDDAVYLRWINRHGFFCYWLFEKRTRQRVTQNVMDFTRGDTQSYELGTGYQRGAGRRQAFTRNDVLPLCVPLVDAETYDYIFDIASSPVVDMYAGKDENNNHRWVSVGVQAGTYTETDDRLQNFVVNILLPTIPTQRL